MPKITLGRGNTIFLNIFGKILIKKWKMWCHSGSRITHSRASGLFPGPPGRVKRRENGKTGPHSGQNELTRAPRYLTSAQR